MGGAWAVMGSGVGVVSSGGKALVLGTEDLSPKREDGYLDTCLRGCLKWPLGLGALLRFFHASLHWQLRPKAKNAKRRSVWRSCVFGRREMKRGEWVG